jgi:hypothetical protein
MRRPAKPITVLGGLTSFGGAGNNYSMHVCLPYNQSHFGLSKQQLTWRTPGHNGDCPTTTQPINQEKTRTCPCKRRSFDVSTCHMFIQTSSKGWKVIPIQQPSSRDTYRLADSANCGEYRGGSHYRSMYLSMLTFNES